MEKEIKYYYIVGVRRRVKNDFNVIFSCDFIIKYTTTDIEKVNFAKAMVDNKLFPTTPIEAIDSVELNLLNTTLNAISLRVRMNPEISVHKFITNDEFDDEWFDMYIKTAEYCEDTKKKLIESRIRL